MPRVPDASMVTSVVRARASVLSDPEKKSRTFVPRLPIGYVGSQLTASDVQRYSIGTLLRQPTWKGRQFAATRYITGGSSSPPDFVFILKNIPDTNDPGNGFFGFRISPAVFVFSKTDANGQDASAFLSAMSTATTFTITIQSGSGQGADIWTINGTPTDEGTHWLFPYAFPPIGPGIILNVGDHVVLTYTA